MLICLGREECPFLVQLLDGREVDVRDREGEVDKARWGVAGTGQLKSRTVPVFNLTILAPAFSFLGCYGRG